MKRLGHFIVVTLCSDEKSGLRMAFWAASAYVCTDLTFEGEMYDHYGGRRTYKPVFTTGHTQLANICHNVFHLFSEEKWYSSNFQTPFVLDV